MFKKATIKEAKLRLALYGTAGSGKTYSSLAIATGMAKKFKTRIALIDSERGSASKYADRFDFYVLELEDKDVGSYIKAIDLAEKEGFGILIIDSLSHAWTELLEYVDLITRTKYRGNSWSAWGEVTPLYKSLIETILNYNGHTIVTLRTKTEWAVEKDENTGKIKPIRVGTAPEFRSGVEYEFDMLGELSIDHHLFISKDRSGKFQDRIIKEPGPEFGEEIADWILEGGVKKKGEEMTMEDKFNELGSEIYGEQWEQRKLNILKGGRFDDLDEERKKYIIEMLEKLKPNR